MFEDLFTLPAIVRRHQQAPLPRERAEFLQNLRQKGTGRSNRRTYAGMLKSIVSAIGLKKLRRVSRTEVRRAAERWVRRRARGGCGLTGPYSIPRFVWMAERWLRFHGKLALPSPTPDAFAGQLNEYKQFMTTERGLSPVTVQGRTAGTAPFLNWYSKHHPRLSSISLNDVDTYLAMRSTDWAKISLASCAATLRAFFRFAENRGWCRSGIADGIKGPPIRTNPFGASGPKWNDVLRLLRTTTAKTAVERRARAILLLFSFYGLRRGEVRQLLVADFSWRAGVFTVRRSKRGGPQQFPVVQELANAIREYIKKARPVTSCGNLFVSFHPPYGPMHPTSLSEIVRFRMKRLGIHSAQFGPHALRRSCATELLNRGASLQEIADFLGHRDCQSVGIYAQFDPRSLRKIADLDLCRHL